MQFEITNTELVPLDVTLLYVGADFAIQALYPTGGADNQIKPGETKVIGRFGVTDSPAGWESAVALGVRSTPGRANFITLAQESIEAVNTRSNAPTTPLQQWLQGVVFSGNANTGNRGADSAQETFAAKLVAWRTDVERK